MLQNLIQTMDTEFLQSTVMRAAAILLCLTVHETCHGFAALALGDPTARSMHRLSLNPLRHIDWLGLAMMFAAGFGWARPVPVDPRYFRHPKQGMALTALAGPASNFLLALASIAVSRWVYIHGPGGVLGSLLFEFFRYVLAPLSIGLGLFNLLPIPPLDGAKVLGAFLPDRTYFTLMRYERYGMLVLLALSFLGVTGNLISGAIFRIFELFFNLIY